MRMKWLGLVTLCTAALALPASAHHSHNAYEVTQWTEIEGVVTEIQLILPHSWVYIDVKDAKGEVMTWALEATGPQGIFRNGVKREDVRAGDKIKVRCHVLRDGSPGCLLGFVTPIHGDAARGHGVENHWD